MSSRRPTHFLRSLSLLLALSGGALATQALANPGGKLAVSAQVVRPARIEVTASEASPVAVAQVGPARGSTQVRITASTPFRDARWRTSRLEGGTLTLGAAAAYSEDVIVPAAEENVASPGYLLVTVMADEL